ncbi:MAG: hypothetical protein ACRCTP_20355 [Aeromonas popoffii]|uniref:hypothetical protein n=1 Tax=Aeromonas popoffii TaxID=70856 RepID=UPI003F3D8C28
MIWETTPGSIIVAVVGLLSVGAIIGAVLTREHGDYLSLLTTIATILQTCISGLTLWVAFWAFQSWRRQFIYPRYVEAMLEIRAEFIRCVDFFDPTIRTYGLSQYTIPGQQEKVDELHGLLGSLKIVIARNHFLIKRFASDELLWFFQSLEQRFRDIFHNIVFANNKSDRIAAVKSLLQLNAEFSDRYDSGWPR